MSVYYLFKDEIPTWESIRKKAHDWRVEWLTEGRIIRRFGEVITGAEGVLIEKIFKSLPDVKMYDSIDGLEEIYLKYCAIKDRVK